MKNKKILVSQMQPTDPKSSFFRLAEKYDLEFTFMPLFSIEPISVNEFRKQRINILEHSATFFSSKNAIDSFFNIAKQLKVDIPKDMKYFCLTELLANYLQKHIVLRRRKVFVHNRDGKDIFSLFKKHEDEKYLVVGSQNRKGDIVDFLKENDISFTEATLFNVFSNNISELAIQEFGMLVFYSPTDVKAIFENFPSYKQNECLIACFGPTTISAASEAGLKVNIKAPQPPVLSMTNAIELHMQNLT